MVFRSPWDVASLARVFYSLGVGDGTDVELWKSFVDGGPVEPELMCKTHTSLDKAARDGRLLNFLQTRTSGDDGGAFQGIGSGAYGLQETFSSNGGDKGRGGPAPDRRFYSSLGRVKPAAIRSRWRLQDQQRG